VNTVAEPAGPFLEEEVESIPIVVGQKNVLTAIATKDDVIKPTWEMDAWFACHAEKIPQTFNLSTWKPDPELTPS
jgi:hypothetical protein